MRELLGVILAGGLSRRMGGTDKALLPLEGRPLISHAVDRLSGQVPNVIVNANGDTRRFGFLKLPIQTDTIDGFAGPLAGVLSAMRWAKNDGSVSHILTAAADTPFFPSDYAERMWDAVNRTEPEIAIASSQSRKHPVFGLWPVDLADALERFLVRENERKVMLFVNRYPNTTVEFIKVSQDPFFNINTPADLQYAQELAQESASA